MATPADAVTVPRLLACSARRAMYQLSSYSDATRAIRTLVPAECSGPSAGSAFGAQ